MRIRLPAALALFAFAAPAGAADFSFSGTFSADDDVVVFDFLVGTPFTVTLRSYSYAGALQADGTVVPFGGFDPILAVFDAAGTLVGDQDDAGAEAVPADPITGEAFDVRLDLALGAGAYSVAVSQYNNFAIGPSLSDGFGQAGATFTSQYGCSNGRFCDAGGSNRTPFFAFDILGVLNAAVSDGTTGGVDVGEGGGGMSVVPVPAAGSLAALGLLALAGLGRRRRRS